MNKFKLDIEYDYDFTLFGISCHEKDYRICWALNNKLRLEFKKVQDIESKEKKKKENTKYPLFEFIDEEAHREYFIIGNRSDSALLIPEQKHADYFLMVRGNFNDAEKEILLKNIKSIQIILTAFEIQPNELKSKQNLIF